MCASEQKTPQVRNADADRAAHQPPSAPVPAARSVTSVASCDARAADASVLARVTGQIVAVETVRMRVPQEDWSLDYVIDTEKSLHFDEYNLHLLYFVRVFYRRHSHSASAGSHLQQIGEELNTHSQNFIQCTTYGIF